MDTPRTNLGDATYLGRQPPDFDMTQEPSFQSPSKDDNLLQQMRNGRAVNLRTPRGSRAPLGDKHNPPVGIGGAEFTPMLKSATRNSARRRGKENMNSLATPALGKIDEDMDMTNVPVESSLFGPSRNMSYLEATPLPEVTASSTQSTPLVLPTRRGRNEGPLQVGNQLSLREQEREMDKIEKENFGLKLKIHFLEEALRKSGPGFSEDALKENTELKVDKVTMQRELSKYKKHLASAEKDLETYQEQILEVRERAKKKYADQGQKAENDALRAENDALQRRLERSKSENETLRADLEDKEAENNTLHRHLDNSKAEIEGLRANLEDKEAENNNLHQRLEDREDDIEDLQADQQRKIEELRQSLDDKETEIEELQKLLQQEDNAKVEQLRQSLEDREAENNTLRQRLEDKEGEIEDLQTDQQQKIDQLRHRLEDREAEIDALRQGLENKEAEIEELQKLLQQEDNSKVEQLRQSLEDKKADIKELHTQLQREKNEKSNIEAQAEKILQQHKLWESERHDIVSKFDRIKNDLKTRTDEKNLLYTQLQRERSEKTNIEAQIEDKKADIKELYAQLQREKSEKANIEAQAEQQHKSWENNRRDLVSKLDKIKSDLKTRTDEKNLLQVRNDALKDESASLQRDVTRLHKQVAELEDDLQREKTLALQMADLRERDTDLGAKESGLSELEDELDRVKSSLRARTDEKNLLQLRNDALKGESASLQRNVSRLQKQVADLEGDLEHEKTHALQVDRESKRLHQLEIERLQNDITSLQDDINRREQAQRADREAKRLHQLEIERLKNDVANLQDEIDRREQVQRADRLGQLEGADKAVSSQQTDELRRDLRQSKTDCQSHANNVVALERKVEVLQANLDKESEHATKRQREAEKLIQDLKRQLELSRREQADHLHHLEDADEAIFRQQISDLRRDLRLSEANCQSKAEEIVALEDEIEVLQASLDEESEDANKRLREADKVIQDLKRELELSRREQVQRADRLGHLEDADKVSQTLRQELEETKQKLYNAEEEYDDFKRRVDETTRQHSRELRQANQTMEDLRRQLSRAQKDSGKTKLMYDELRRTLDRVRSERAAFQASAEKLQFDCDRLYKGAQESLAWIQAKKSQRPDNATGSTPATIKKAAMATFRYGDVVMDVVDQKDHEAVIRAADSAQRRHEKEIRGMALQMEYMQARWERESKLRNDSAFAKKFLQLQLNIADACNKADLRVLDKIHQDLGLKSPAELVASKKQKTQKRTNNLRVFVSVVRAVARMRVDARKWGEHEKTRQKIIAQAQKQREMLC